jgi:hypothetical protein
MKCLIKQEKISREGSMINIEQFKDFQVAFKALESKTVDVAIIEIREEGDSVSCYVILENKHSALKVPDNYHRVNDFNGFRTFRVFKNAEAVKTDLN